LQGCKWPQRKPAFSTGKYSHSLQKNPTATIIHIILLAITFVYDFMFGLSHEWCRQSFSANDIAIPKEDLWVPVIPQEKSSHSSKEQFAVPTSGIVWIFQGRIWFRWVFGIFEQSGEFQLKQTLFASWIWADLSSVPNMALSPSSSQCHQTLSLPNCSLEWAI
jgi:hypothetical protein